MGDDETKALIEHIRSSFSLTDAERLTYPTLDWDRIVTRDDFDRLLSALSSHPDEETEWEYGVRHIGQVTSYFSEAYSREIAGADRQDRVMRRRKAGSWSPVPADREGTDA